MRSIPSNQNELSWWLSYIDSISAREVELGLDRVGQVAEKLGIQTLAKNTIVVAGTNGKGSCIAAMESILKRVGCNVGTYTSPHIARFSERIKLNGVEVEERQLCAAFKLVDDTRGEVKLTYFECSTLVAFGIFAQNQLDFALLEVGLGGRLDAVNIIDADVSIITSIDLDHQDWLGDNRESIGREKAGIIRKNKPLVYGDKNPTSSVLGLAKSNKSRVYLVGRDFFWNENRSTSTFTWFGGFESKQTVFEELPLPNLSLGNVSLAIQALYLMNVGFDRNILKFALNGLYLPGRFDKCVDKVTGVNVILDVAHNTAAAAMLGSNLRKELVVNSYIKQISVVIGVMADKDVNGITSELIKLADNWYISDVDSARSMPANKVAASIDVDDKTSIVKSGSLVDGYNRACSDLSIYQQENPGHKGLVVVTGSFLCVGAVQALVTR